MVSACGLWTETTRPGSLRGEWAEPGRGRGPGEGALCRERGAAFVCSRCSRNARCVRRPWGCKCQRRPRPGGRPSSRNHAPASRGRWQGAACQWSNMQIGARRPDDPSQGKEAGTALGRRRAWGRPGGGSARSAARERCALHTRRGAAEGGEPGRSRQLAGARRRELFWFPTLARGARSSPRPRRAANMGNAGSMDSQQTDFRAHNVPLKLPMPEPGELEERFAIVLVSVRRGPGAPGGEAQLTPAPSSSPRAWSEPPVPRGRRPPSPLWPPQPHSSPFPSSPRAQPSRGPGVGPGARSGAGGPGRAAWPAQSPLSGGRSTSQRVCPGGAAWAWREGGAGPGKGGSEPLKLFVGGKKTQKPQNQKARKSPSPCGPSGARGPGQTGACGRQLAASKGELGGGHSGLVEGSSLERER